MKKADIIRFAREQGAEVDLKTLDDMEIISVFIEKPHTGNSAIENWRHGIFIREINSFWEIGYCQNSKTRLLMDKEVIEVIDQWCKNPTDDLLNSYKS